MSVLENGRLVQQISMALEACGLLRAIEIEQHEKSLVIVLVPKGLIDDRAMRMCLNVGGERKRGTTQRRESFLSGTSFAETATRIWIERESTCEQVELQVFLELIILGLQLSVSLSASSSSYSLDEFLRGYQTKEEVLSSYAGMVSQVIRDGADRPTGECEEALFDLWLCCPKHRLLLAQRLLLVNWLHHLSKPQEDAEHSSMRYVRRSSEMQKENSSIDAQKRFIREACRLWGLPEPVFYEDDERSARGEQIAKRC